MLLLKHVPICVKSFHNHFSRYCLEFKILLPNWYLTQILTAIFMTVTNLTVSFITDIWWKSTVTYIPPKYVQVRVERWSRQRRVAQITTKTTVLRVTTLLPHVSPRHFSMGWGGNATNTKLPQLTADSHHVFTS